MLTLLEAIVVSDLIRRDINYEIGEERRMELAEITEKYFLDGEGVK